MSQICSAIKEKKIIEFNYHGYHRIVEPHLVGVHKDAGTQKLRGYQTAGGSEHGNIPDWRLFNIDEIESLKITDQNFSAARSGYNPNDRHMSSVICRI